MQMPTISRRRALAYAVAVLVLLALGGRLLTSGREPPESRERHARPATLAAEAAPAPTLVVHVVGAVEEPGLYELKEGSRVDDAITRAGGAKEKAALELVNLAAPVADGQQVVVPNRGEAASATPAGGGASAGSAPTNGPVHLNSATLEELDALPGIGPVTAQKILDYRTEHGSFSSESDLDAVPGIGPTRLEELKPLVAP